ncbi:hypothetical protein GCM10027187_45050 [Streptosporangium sandarakinum]|uniref:Fibronectin type-III domain-containing protein n=1 Tax=Streptosporangium sandarakinum TaxID=1260955 RepID=A0A852UV82_9ACTN|nr:hypothetical protein [Streptosporangium sandarakinum]
MDVSSAPWLTFGGNPSPPETAPKLGWMTESVEIDPFDSNRMMYGTGATIYGTEDLLKWDAGGQFTIKPMVRGLEETAVLDLVSPPTGRTYPALYAAATVDGTAGVFRSDDAGATWVRINDDRHRYGNMGDAITGDPRIHGRVYLGTNGRGVLYADPSGTVPPGDDTTPPSRSGRPAASSVTSSGATLTWAASTDDTGVSGYDVYREAGTTDVKAGSPASPAFTLTGLSPATSYTYYVVARDAAGNVSAASDPVTFTTTSGGGQPGGCTAAYKVVNSWPGGSRARSR